VKEGIVRYVKIIKRLFIAFSAVAIPALMVSLVFAFSKFFAFYFIAPAILLVWLVVYGVYAMRVSMGTVIGVEIAGGSVNLKTKRKTFTYDLENGCIRMKVSARAFVGTFVNQNSQDKFIFYRRVLFSRYGDEQFTADDLRPLCANIDSLVNEAKNK